MLGVSSDACRQARGITSDYENIRAISQAASVFYQLRFSLAGHCMEPPPASTSPRVSIPASTGGGSGRPETHPHYTTFHIVLPLW